jgi:hypothetical protein
LDWLFDRCGDEAMDRRSFIAGGAALWAATPQLAEAQAGWVLLGSRTVNWAAGGDSITVRAGGPVSALSFRTRGGEIFITNVEVSFNRGGQERIPVNMRIRPNMRSNVVRLQSSNREIRRIHFRYRRVNTRGPAMRTTIEVFGRR